jgi:hypothetical protein
MLSAHKNQLKVSLVPQLILETSVSRLVSLAVMVLAAFLRRFVPKAAFSFRDERRLDMVIHWNYLFS